MTWEKVLVGFIVGVLLLVLIGAITQPIRDREACIHLGEEVLRGTFYRDSKCYIEIAPELFVPQTELVLYLDFMEPVDG